MEEDMKQKRAERRQERLEMKRERDVHLLYGAAFRNIPHLDQDAEKHVPRPSPDSTLTALCQLTAIRLGCQRSMISLFDDHRQHILAEATCDLSLRPEAPQNAPLDLWLGNDSHAESPVLIVTEVSQDDRAAHRAYVYTPPDLHFIACAALLSPAGARVGTLCVFDNKPRDGLSQSELRLLRDLAATVIDYLHTYSLRDQYRRGERFTRGLTSFADGASALLPFENATRNNTPTPLGLTSDDSSVTEREAPATEDIANSSSTSLSRQSSTASQRSIRSLKSRSTRNASAQHRSIRTLQDKILPIDSKSMFSRAANVLMASSDLDGVLILDASVAANGQRRRAPAGHESGTEPPSESYHSRSSSSEDGDESAEISDSVRAGKSSIPSSKMCQVLGVATNAEYGSLLEPDLARMLHENPRGRVFTLTVGGLSTSSTEESALSSATKSEEVTSGESITSKPKTRTRALKSSKALQSMFPGARSVAFIPFWDYERSRWFAGCLCWSNSPYRLLSASVDLAYFKVFSHSIMRELSRLDAIALNQAKTTFVASISHELRSPLHGILGTLEFIKDTPLDSFQTSMLNAMNACGQTLLDTIDHVMDYAKISETRRNVSSIRLKDANTIRLSSKPLKSQRNKDPAFDVSIATEEVVEAVFSGSSYTPVTAAPNEIEVDTPSSPSSESTNTSGKRKTCFIVFDMAAEEDWIYSFPVGSWRRIVMNIFGNALKYTSSGYIYISLKASGSTKPAKHLTTITLTIIDTGPGMSASFLANRAFQPFSQENSHASGTGLGLSIVKQIIETNGGKIEVSSDHSSGTKFTVKLAVTRPQTTDLHISAQRTSFLSSIARLEGRRICILHRKVVQTAEKPDLSRLDEGLVRFTNALVTTLEKHLKMTVFQTSDWEGNDADIVICPELSFEYLSAIRRRRINDQRAPVTVFVALDALEAAVLRSDARVMNRQSVVEIITQPCGPYKLAFILNRCLDRFALPEENIRRPSSDSHSSDSPSPQLSLIETETLEQEPPFLPSSIPYSPESSTEPLAITTGIIAPTTAGVLTFRSAASSRGRDNTRTWHVLITDDNLINRRLLVAFVKKQNLDFELATNGLEALEAYQQGAPKFDAILMDMSMPIMDGMSATRAIRQYEQNNNLPRCSIVALTGLASASAKLEAWNSGIDHFMTKPINFKALEHLIKKEQKRKARIAADAAGKVEETYDEHVGDGAIS
ncbi:Nn.00g063550.m01.CDS01 [Neocucurbitaria sp. VM-36]